MSPTLPEEDELLDKVDIEEALLRYCRGMDKVDEDTVRSCFWPEAIDDHIGFYSGRVHDLLETMMGMRRRLSIATHALTNLLICVQGPNADSTAYVRGIYRYDFNGEDFEWTAGAIYTNNYEKREGTWKISYHRADLQWSTVSRVAQVDPHETLFGGLI